jgi:hypothetical protein
MLLWYHTKSAGTPPTISRRSMCRHFILHNYTISVWPEPVSSPVHTKELELLGILAQGGICILKINAGVARYLQEEVFVHKVRGTRTLDQVHIDGAVVLGSLNL